MDATDPDPPLARDAHEDGDSDQEPHVSRLDSAASGAAPSLRGWRMGLRLGGAVALVTLLAVAAVALTPLLPRPAPPKPPRLAITALQFPDVARSCISGAAWSPDSARVALVRDSDCDMNTVRDANDPSALVFDAATGKLLGSAPLALELLTSGAPPTGSVTLTGIAWSPRGDQLAAPYIRYAQDPSRGPAPTSAGMALLTLHGATLSLTAFWDGAPIDSAYPPPLAQNGPRKVAEWDMRVRGDGPRTLTVAPAYAYQWNPDGSLAPILLSLPQPDRKDTVSMWRDGQLWLVNARQCFNGLETFLPQPYLALTLSRLAWSPDGAWLVELNGGARYPLPAGAPEPAPHATPASCSPGPAPEDVTLGLEPDKGLRAVASLFAAGNAMPVSLAWRPDGKRLAAFTFNAGSAGSAIAIYDCATGTLARRYTPGQIPNAGQPGTGPAKNFSTIFTGGAWSPDGQRLLVEAAGNGALPFILGPHALGE